MNVIIVGGGASGIACAIRIKQNKPHTHVTVIERLDEVCKKIYATGNGRCNITNSHADDYLLTVSFLNSIGLVTRSDNEGRIYPYSNQAATVVDILTDTCKKLGINFILGEKVITAEKNADIYNVYTDKGTYSCNILILATGGMAQAALGSDGSGYTIAKGFGHNITDLKPGLVMLKSPNKNCHALKGIRAKCNIRIEENGKEIAKEYGELLFTEYGISGIVVMDLSEYISDKNIENGKSKYNGIIDFVPDFSEEELVNHIKQFNGLDGILPKKLCSVLEKQTGNDYNLMAKYAKNWKIIINGTRGFNFAQITCGGVSTDEIDCCGQSLLNHNLYILGELTDNQFKCGGYNLNYAFASGIKAADNITESKNDYDKN